MKKIYETPEVEILLLDIIDVITNPSSGGMTDGGEGNDDFEDDFEVSRRNIPDFIKQTETRTHSPIINV